MGPTTRSSGLEPQTNEHYVWDVEGKPLAAELEFDLVDRLLQEVMRGFGVVPRRGVEMGGILLGSVRSEGGRAVVHVEDFEPIPCQHTKGMTWQLSEPETQRFEEVLGRWAKADGKRTYAVGFYRSHTREGMGMSEEDIAMFDRYFPDEAAITLLVKPFATRVSVGALFFRENGQLRSGSSYKEFPFRRRELGGEKSEPESTQPETPQSPPQPAGRPQPFPKASSPLPDSSTVREGVPSMASTPMPTPNLVSDQLTFGIPTSKTDDQSGKKAKSGWVWIPLSFIFLLLGVVLGVQVSMSVSSRIPAAFRSDPYTLNLTATPAGDGVHVRWDRDAAAIKSSSRGLLEITDGGNQKVVNLDASQLQNGSVIYRKTTNELKFRLEVNARDRVTVSETLEFRP